MIPDSFYINNHMTASLEYSLQTCDTYEDFEKNFSTEFLDEDGRVGMYLENLLYKYDRKGCDHLVRDHERGKPGNG